MELSDSNIIWEGECDECHGNGIDRHSIDAIALQDCPKCNGTGVYSRPATLGEVIEVAQRLLRRKFCTTPISYQKATTINNGTLKIKE